MEKVKAHKCRPFHRCYNKTFAICFGVYAKRHFDEIRQGKPERGPDRPGQSPAPQNDCPTDDFALSSYWMWQRVSTTCTRTIRYTEI